MANPGNHMKRRIPYGMMNYAEIREKNAYLIDKTPFIQALESVSTPVFLRPRRFGKSLFCSMLHYYYDINQAERFEELFGSTWIGQQPTPDHNRFIILKLDFSVIQTSSTLSEIETSFRTHCNAALRYMGITYPDHLGQMPEIDLAASASANLDLWLGYLKSTGAPPVYVIIDEYDNFANQLITSHQDSLYRDLTAGESFLRSYFKVLKQGRQSGAIANIFITGVLPITLDDLSSGFNIATFLTLDPSYEAMLGFSSTELSGLLDQIYADYHLDYNTRGPVEDLITSQYNGYHFVDVQGESIYNPTMVMYFLRYFAEHQSYPRHLTDLNLRTDLSWIQRITATTENTRELVTSLVIADTIPYDDTYLTSKFSMSQFFEKEYFPVSLFYLGLLTRHDPFSLRLPNLNMRSIIVEYFNELSHIDVSTRYREMMQQFVSDPSLPRLFAGYWDLYVSQLPEAVFTQVNENFYRTTFYELCSRYLSIWFTWNIERSYPQGRSDLEFVGKYNEKFAGIRWLIEFKYLSHRASSKIKEPLTSFTPRQEDITQISGYAAGLRQEHPEASISLYLIYCFGNKGYRVFEIANPDSPGL